MNAQISFLDGTLSLIHIPLDLYSNFVQPILKVLLPPSLKICKNAPDDSEDDLVDAQYAFLNISITPLECSIVCDSRWANAVFEPSIQKLPTEARRMVSISKETYAVFSVTCAGVDAGSRVVDLTSPLALAGVPIFFITTYYSDFILVPSKDRNRVCQTLEARGFAFSEQDASFTSPDALAHVRGPSHLNELPSTPPPSNIGELQIRTFQQLRKRKVVPYVEPELHLVQCSGSSKADHSRCFSHRPSLNRMQSGNGHRRQSWVSTVNAELYTSIVAALVSEPRFLSVTLAQDDPPSLLLEKSLLPMFGNSLVAPTDGSLVPIILDLADLPIEVTGIVSGVAAKLVQEMHVFNGIELSYLSTARAGAVILPEKQATEALEILRPSLGKE